MLFTTPEQFIVLATLLLGGLMIGYAIAPSPRKWKRRVTEQSDSFTEYHRDAEDRLRAANQRAADLKAEADALRADHAEAERTIVDLRAAAATAVAAASAAAVVPATPEHVAEPAVSVEAPEPQPEPVAEAEPAVIALPAASEAIAPAPVEQIAASPTRAEIVDTVPDPQLAAEIVPQPSPVPDVLTEPEPVTHDLPVAHEEPVPPPVLLAEPAVEPITEAHPEIDPITETSVGTYDDPPAFKSVETVPMTPAPTEAPPAPIGAAEPEMPSKGWFASSARDDLTRLRGIDDVLNIRLFGLGVTRFEDVEKLSAEDEMALEQRLSLPVGYIAREQWRTQGALLRAGQDDEHATHFGAAHVNS